MNELRMYVEGLFEGKVLTAENIELKEEIYGNLMARYEDLLAEGVDEREALRRTKESITSIEEMLDVPISNCGDEDVAPIASTHGDSRAQETGTRDDDIASSDACKEPGVPAPPAILSDEGRESDVTSSADGRPVMEGHAERKNRLLIMGACAAVVLLIAVGIFGWRMASLGKGDGALGAVSTETDGAASTGKGAGDELMKSVMDATPGELSPYLGVDLEDASAIEGLLRSLPMGGCVTDVDVTIGQGVLGFALREVPDAYDGDSIELALAYNVTAVLCVMPDVSEMRVTVTESDEPADENYYVFTRDDVQRRFGLELSDALLNEAGWSQLRDDNLCRGEFAEDMVDAAEREWH